MARNLVRSTITIEKEAKDFFDRNLIKLSPFVQKAMRELLPIVTQQKLEKESIE